MFYSQMFCPGIARPILNWYLHFGVLCLEYSFPTIMIAAVDGCKNGCHRFKECSGMSFQWTSFLKVLRIQGSVIISRNTPINLDFNHTNIQVCIVVCCCKV